jgi:hypothetical protein
MPVESPVPDDTILNIRVSGKGRGRPKKIAPLEDVNDSLSGSSSTSTESDSDSDYVEEETLLEDPHEVRLPRGQQCVQGD